MTLVIDPYRPIGSGEQVTATTRATDMVTVRVTVRVRVTVTFSNPVMLIGSKRYKWGQNYAGPTSDRQ